MLNYIKIRNLNSIGSEVFVDFKKGDYGFKENMVSREGIVNPMAFFGANGSGKTSFLSVFKFIRDLMNLSTSDLLFPYPHFSRETNLDLADSEIEIDFSYKKAHYFYQLCFNYLDQITREILLSETLKVERKKATFNIYSLPSKEKIEKYGHLVNGKSYSIIRQLGIQEYTEKDPLTIVKNAYDYLSSIGYIDFDGKVFASFVEKEGMDHILADKSSKVKDILKKYKDFPVYDLELLNNPISKDDPNPKKSLWFNLNGADLKLPVRLLSNGMKSHSNLLSTILSMPEDTLLVIDELDRSLHAFSAKEFIDDFNKNFRIQLIFSSHNTSLLQNLRPDQIVFSKWNNFKVESHYFRLNVAFPGIREVNNIEKMYLGGAFDSLGQE